MQKKNVLETRKNVYLALQKTVNELFDPATTPNRRKEIIYGEYCNGLNLRAIRPLKEILNYDAWNSIFLRINATKAKNTNLETSLFGIALFLPSPNRKLNSLEKEVLEELYFATFPDSRPFKNEFNKHYRSCYKSWMNGLKAHIYIDIRTAFDSNDMDFAFLTDFINSSETSLRLTKDILKEYKENFTEEEKELLQMLIDTATEENAFMQHQMYACTC